MGDRAVVGFRDNLQTPTIFIYQHWVDGEQSDVLAGALNASRPRWGDNSYATRICLSQIVGANWNGELGYGIYVGDTSHGADYGYILVVDWSRKVVMVCLNSNSDEVIGELSFDDFLSHPQTAVSDILDNLETSQ
ncbi:MAG: hypothetical protein J0651_01480 [Actinobacteria bacterium]|jgi:hypothetical protein|nr:hypothetical protein [Actinomycetota bacterium]